MFIGFKMFSLKCKSCARNNLAKKHVWLSIETYLGIFYDFGYKPKYSYTIMYESKIHCCRMNYFK